MDYYYYYSIHKEYFRFSSISYYRISFFSFLDKNYHDLKKKFIGLIKTNISDLNFIDTFNVYLNNMLLYYSFLKIYKFNSSYKLINVDIHFKELIKKMRKKRREKYINFLRNKNKKNKYNNKILKFII